MPLNKEHGEMLEDMDSIFRVVPIEKYKNLPNLRTVVKSKSTGKFQREIDIEKPIWQAAYEYAMQAFVNSGAKPGATLHYDVIAQEYPRTGIINFIFCAVLGGREMYVQAPFLLTNQQIADLEVRNLWLPYEQDIKLRH